MDMDQCTTIDQVVHLINGDSDKYHSDMKPYMLAGMYAVDAMLDREDWPGQIRARLDGHLNYLADAGAQFDYNTAYAAALYILNHYPPSYIELYRIYSIFEHETS